MDNGTLQKVSFLFNFVPALQADMRKAKEKALYKKKGSYPEGMYL